MPFGLQEISTPRSAALVHLRSRGLASAKSTARGPAELVGRSYLYASSLMCCRSICLRAPCPPAVWHTHRPWMKSGHPRESSSQLSLFRSRLPLLTGPSESSPFVTSNGFLQGTPFPILFTPPAPYSRSFRLLPEPQRWLPWASFTPLWSGRWHIRRTLLTCGFAGATRRPCLDTGFPWPCAPASG